MSSVLHPVGPEPERTYWLRRVAVVVAVAVALSVLTAMFSSGDEQQHAVPAAATASPAAQPTSAGTPTADAATPVDESTTLPMSVSTIASSLDPDATPTLAPATSTSKPTAKATSKPAREGPMPCDASDLRATLRGDSSVRAKQRTTFRLSLINGGPTSCVVEVNPDSFELKVYSGIDRIWTTDHCASSVKPIKKVVKSEAAVQWSITWNGRRSAPDCKNRPEIPKPGTYVATAQLDGAKPVSLAMALKA